MDKLKILVAEDDKVTQRLYNTFLREDIFEKRLVQSGEEALELYLSWHPDIIILDIMLPGMTGYSLLAKIRQELQDRFIPIIISSSLSSKQDVTDCLKLGIQGYLTKPIEWKKLPPDVLACYQKAFPDKADSIEELKRKLEQTADHPAKDTTAE